MGNGRNHYEEEDEDDEWLDVYNIEIDFEVGNIKGTYYQTFGGGPEGGYVETENAVYHIKRTWFEEWKIYKTRYVLIKRDIDYGLGIQIKSELKKN